MPRSAPFTRDALWPARMVAEALVRESLGAFVLPLLARAVAVQRSSTAAPGKRPRAAAHLRSFQVLPPVDPPSRIVIVDDVVTSGATMLAAISAVFDAMPGLPPKGFALFRTQSTGELRRFRAPRARTSACSGTAGHGGNHRRGSLSGAHGAASATRTAGFGRGPVVAHGRNVRAPVPSSTWLHSACNLAPRSRCC